MDSYPIGQVPGAKKEHKKLKIVVGILLLLVALPAAFFVLVMSVMCTDDPHAISSSISLCVLSMLSVSFMLISPALVFIVTLFGKETRIKIWIRRISFVVALIPGLYLLFPFVILTAGKVLGLY